MNNSTINNNRENFNIRIADEKDIPLILEFIIKTASYENMKDDVTATEERIRHSLFEKKIGTVLIGEYNNVPISYAIFFYNFSSFDGKLGVYLEDIFVEPEFRGMGFARRLIAHISKIAINNGCERVEWACLDWNEHAIRAYKKMGAVPQKQWVIFKLSGNELIERANEA